MPELLFVKSFHLAGFLGCLLASLSKNLLLRRPVIEGAALSRLVMLDRVSGLSSVIILATGIWMAGWIAKPTDYYLASPLFWGKVILFTLASAAVLTTKPLLKRARADGRLLTAPRTRLLLAFDFSSILVIATLGIWLARSFSQ
ncbi:MAG: DUF2214 family protein [Hyphomonas sp.]|uniref:DUF2214 family protein n=1 Tax=Hyphomonas sp. TaxID=87 RepID=UPI00352758D4